MPDRIDSENRLYVLRHEHTNRRGKVEIGYTCLGFDVAERKARNVAQWLNIVTPTATPGTPEHFAEYESIMAQARVYCLLRNASCPAELSPQLVGLEGKRVEVITLYDETRRFQVCKSTGWLPCHLEIARANCHGGPAAEHEYKSVRVIR